MTKKSKFTTAFNSEPEGAFWVTPSGKEIKFDAMTSDTLQTLLKAIAAGNTACHEAKWDQLADRAIKMRIGVPLRANPHSELGNLLEGAALSAQNTSSGARHIDTSALSVLHDKIEEDGPMPAEEVYMYALRWMIHFNKVPMRLYIQDETNEDEPLFEADSSDSYVFVWGACVELIDDGEEDLDEERPTRPKRRGGKGVKKKVLTGEEVEEIRMLRLSLEACNVDEDVPFHNVYLRHDSVRGRLRNLQLKCEMTESQRFSYIFGFPSFNEAVGALASALFALNLLTPKI